VSIATGSKKLSRGIGIEDQSDQRLKDEARGEERIKHWEKKGDSKQERIVSMCKTRASPKTETAVHKVRGSSPQLFPSFQREVLG